MMGQPLASTPGTEHVYSNLGYNILGRVIEHQTELSYGDAVRQLVLQPAGVKRMALMTRASPQAGCLMRCSTWTGGIGVPSQILGYGGAAYAQHESQPANE